LVLARDGFITGIVGLYAFASLAAPHPLFFAVSRPFGQQPDEDWDQWWRDNPRFRHTMRTTTIAWGAVLTLDGALKTVLAYTLNPDLVPAVTAIQYAAVLTTLIGFTVWYVRRRAAKA
jgi:hypothetical protein